MDWHSSIKTNMQLRIYWLLLVFSLLSLTSIAQEYTISGTLVDATERTPLESATVYAETIKDTTLITYTISDRKGNFELQFDTGLPALNLTISYTGYTSYSQKVTLDQQKIDLGNIDMNVMAEQLEDVVITASRAPITIKKDTLEFNVASFKTKKGANVEDLLKELPGVEVDAQGNITVNGKTVNKILVNGKPFFGDDPTIATRNLTKEIVDKIQVTDTKTDSEAFTGEAGDDENKTINITIDEEKNKGVFGRVAAGGGTDERFEYAGLVNYFDNDVRLSALAGGNNINSPGFSFGEIEKMFGNARYININQNGSFNFGGRSFGGGEGITNSRTAGANYADDFGKETDLTVDYFYNAANAFNNETRNRENILPDNRFFSSTRTSTTSNNDGHSANLQFKTQIDSTFLINVRFGLDYNTGDSRFQNDEETRSVNGDLTNESSTIRNSEEDRTNFENRLTITNKIGAKGAFVRTRLENDMDRATGLDRLRSNTMVFGDDPQTINRNQLTDGEQNSNRFTLRGEARIPLLAEKFFLDLEYAYSDDTREDRQSVFDFNESTQEFTDFNLEQSTNFTNSNRSSRPEIGLRYNNEKLRVRLSTGYVFRTLASEDGLRDIDFSNDFNAVELGANVSYRFGPKLSIYSGYNLSNNAPSVSQLSPYVDVSDPLNIVQGNPDLDPSNQHRLYMGLNNYDFQTQTGLFSYVNASYGNDRVVAKTTVDENFVRNTTYANVDGFYSFNANVGYNKTKKLDSLRSIKYNVGMSYANNKAINFNNDVQYASRTTTLNPNVGIGFTWEDLFEIRPSYRFSYSNNTFDLDLFEDNTYVQHQLRLQTTTTYPKKLEWSNTVLYTYNPDVAPGFQNSSVFWNSSLAYSILQDKGLITLKVYDLLNQNTNASRSSTADYIQDVESTVLQRYFMLSFSYKFNTLGKKGETKDSSFFFN